MDLRTYFTVGLSGLQMEFPTDTLQGNIGKYSCFKLQNLSQANSFQETDTISFILLALVLMELYIDAANLGFPSPISCSFLA